MHLLLRLPVDEGKLKAELPAFTAGLREERRREALSEWLHKQYDQAHVTVASSQKKTASE